MLGNLAASLFVAGAIFGETWVDSRRAKCYISIQNASPKSEKYEIWINLGR